MYSQQRTPARRPLTLTPAPVSSRSRTPRSAFAPSTYGSPATAGAASPSTPNATTTMGSPAPFLTPMPPGSPGPSKSGALSSRKTPMSIRSHTPLTSAHSVRKRQRARKVLKETDRHRVETISSLPSAVIESIRTIVEPDAFANITGNIDGDSGYVWLIIGSSLFLWNFKEQQELLSGGQCLLFQLPTAPRHSFDADLVCIISSSKEDQYGKREPRRGLLVSSKQGHLRYWPDINRSSTLESSLELTRKEYSSEDCFATRLAYCKGAGYVLGTNQDTLFQIAVVKSSGKDCLESRLLERPVGMLGSIKQILWWGKTAQPSSAVISLVPKKARDDAEFTDLYVLTETALQKWRLSRYAQEKMVYEVGLQEMIKNTLEEDEREEREARRSVDGMDEGGNFEGEIFDLWLLDMKKSKLSPSLFVLAAFTTFSSDLGKRVVTYTIVEVDISRAQPQLVKNKLAPFFQPPVEPEGEASLLQRHMIRLALPAGGPGGYVHWPTVVVLTRVPEDERDLNCVQLDRDERIVGSGAMVTISDGGMDGTVTVTSEALYLSLKYGVVSLIQHDLLSNIKTKRKVSAQLEEETEFAIPDTPSLTLRPQGRGTLSMPSTFGAITSDSGVRLQQLSAAFFQYCGGIRPQEGPLHELAKDREAFNAAVESLSTSIVNAHPTSDPRWAEEEDRSFRGASDTGSLLLKHQLEEKIQKHAVFIAFLNLPALWPSVSDATRISLFMHSEKLHATSALREHQNRVSSDFFLGAEKEKGKERAEIEVRRQWALESASIFQSVAREILQKSVRVILAQRNIPAEAWTLTGCGPQDIFYSEVAAVDQILEIAQERQSEMISPSRDTFSSIAGKINPRELLKVANIVREVNTIFEAILMSAVNRRQNNPYTKDYPQTYAIVSWTASERLRALLRRQHGLTSEVLNNLRVHYLANPTPALPAPSFGAEGQSSLPQNSAYGLKTFELHGTIGMLLSQLYNLSDLLLSAYVEEVQVLGVHVAQAHGDMMQEEEEEEEEEQTTGGGGRHGNARQRLLAQQRAIQAQFEDIRADIIKPLRLAGNVATSSTEASSVSEEWEGLVVMGTQFAMRLAEKFKEFTTLVEVCDQCNNEEGLHHYMARFEAEGFAKTLFAWYLSNGKRHKLLSLPSEYDVQLAKFLEPYPELSWIHAHRVRNYASAATALQTLALQNSRSLTERKTYLSLGKLSCLALGDQPAREPINTERYLERTNQLLYIAKAQVMYKLKPAGSATLEGASPMTPEEIIVHFIGSKKVKKKPDSEKFISALEIFSKSDLLRTEEQNKKLLKKIWRRVFSCYNWASLAADWQRDILKDNHVEEAIKGTAFYQTAINESSQGLFNKALFQEILSEYIRRIQRGNKPSGEVTVVVEEEGAQLSQEQALTRLLYTVWELIMKEIQENEERRKAQEEAQQQHEEDEEEEEGGKGKGKGKERVRRDVMVDEDYDQGGGVAPVGMEGKLGGEGVDEDYEDEAEEEARLARDMEYLREASGVLDGAQNAHLSSGVSAPRPSKFADVDFAAAEGGAYYEDEEEHDEAAYVKGQGQRFGYGYGEDDEDLADEGDLDYNDHAGVADEGYAYGGASEGMEDDDDAFLTGVQEKRKERRGL